MLFPSITHSSAVLVLVVASSSRRKFDVRRRRRRIAFERMNLAQERYEKAARVLEMRYES